MIVREERAGDEAVIAALTKAAFEGAEHTDGTEHALPAKLRDAGCLTVSLVAEVGDGLAGHVAFSPVTIADGSPNWFGLGPVSVITSRQRQGIGTALIREGMARLRRSGAYGCVVLGDPSYYGRFGFEHDPRLVYPGPSPEYFQRIVFVGPAPQGVVSYSKAFG